MFVSPFFRISIRPLLFNWIKQSRGIRPSIKIGKDKFQLSLDVRDFDKDEIRVKARPEYVIIEGKQETKSKKGYMIRQFCRKFKLPQGCSPSSMKTYLSSDGILTVTAPRTTCDMNLPCETVLPITFTEGKEDNLVNVQHPKQKPEEKPKS